MYDYDRTAALRITPSKQDGQDGFMVSGKPPNWGTRRPVKVFVTDRRDAEKLKDLYQNETDPAKRQKEVSRILLKK